MSLDSIGFVYGKNLSTALLVMKSSSKHKCAVTREFMKCGSELNTYNQIQVVS